MRLSDAAIFLSGGTPKKDNSGFWGGQIPWFSASNMDERFLNDSSLRLTESGVATGSRMAPKGSTLLLVRGSGLFNHIPICFADRDVAFNQDVKALCPKPGIDPLFLHYAVEVQRKTLADNVGVTGIGAGKFETDFVKALPFPDVDPQIQPKIGELASSFDRSIDLNRKTNVLLASITAAIFRDWFIHFGPVLRRQEGRTDPVAILGGLIHDAARAARIVERLPSRLAEDGVPEGWETAPLEETLVLQRGFDLPKPRRTQGRFPVIAASGPSGTHAEFKVAGPGVCTGRSGVLGKVYFVDEYFWPLNTSLWVKAYPNSTPLYAYHVLREIDLAVYNAGSAVPTLNRNHVHGLPVTKPPMGLIMEFDELGMLLYRSIRANFVQNTTLAETRDYLLPRLMSGKIRVADAERMVG